MKNLIPIFSTILQIKISIIFNSKFPSFNNYFRFQILSEFCFAMTKLFIVTISPYVVISTMLCTLIKKLCYTDLRYTLLHKLFCSIVFLSLFEFLHSSTFCMLRKVLLSNHFHIDECPKIKSLSCCLNLEWIGFEIPCMVQKDCTIIFISWYLHLTIKM